jgi:hypothetical protein
VFSMPHKRILYVAWSVLFSTLERLIPVVSHTTEIDSYYILYRRGRSMLYPTPHRLIHVVSFTTEIDLCWNQNCKD